MEYRPLTGEELASLEKEFVDFLILNGITADSWTKIKSTDSVQAQLIIDQFSDVIFESIFRKNQYFERVTATEIHCIHALPDSYIRAAMILPDNANGDFNNVEFIERAKTNPPEGIKIYLQEEKYPVKRERFLFELTQKEHFISDGKMYKTLCLLHATKK